ncbi:hypothetical protein FDP41_001795 [Naegleria fowleri]|uniref:Uncharacterized protein n=1 Tax=Naegleria fowleri TaxID=5763 RepID=A0A6A5BXT6_NAEFO|nr:uncharacterized protein FDP41_001795 [Naegleria fowleri]KAF0979452.1 hypothetical protein FDP41_001795 [Naegleria fowleri]
MSHSSSLNSMEFSSERNSSSCQMSSNSSTNSSTNTSPKNSFITHGRPRKLRHGINTEDFKRNYFELCLSSSDSAIASCQQEVKVLSFHHHDVNKQPNTHQTNESLKTYRPMKTRLRNENITIISFPSSMKSDDGSRNVSSQRHQDKKNKVSKTKKMKERLLSGSHNSIASCATSFSNQTCAVNIGSEMHASSTNATCQKETSPHNDAFPNSLLCPLTNELIALYYILFHSLPPNNNNNSIHSSSHIQPPTFEQTSQTMNESGFHFK